MMAEIPRAQQVKDQPGGWEWKGTSSGEYTAKSVYKAMTNRPEISNEDLYSLI